MTRRVVLLQPPGACRDFTRSQSVYPPLGLLQLAAAASDDAIVLDADGLGWTYGETLTRVAALEPLAVGLSVTSFTLDRVERYARALGALGLAVIVGGPHASLAPADTLRRCPSVSWLVRGEGEVVFADLVARLRRGESPLGLPGVCGRGPKGLLLDPTVLRVPDLDGLPPVSYAGLPLASYWCPDAVLRPMVTMSTSAGCPHRCAFCSSPALLGHKVRFRSVERIVADLEALVSEHGVREVSFVDDVFTVHKRHLLELCTEMTRRALGLSWFCNARADQITEEVAAAMRAAGCHQVYLGFESGDQEMLERVDKDATVERLEQGAETLRQNGIHRSVGFVIGLPGETERTVDASIAMARRVRPERLQLTRLSPLVGSRLADVGSVSNGFHQRNSDAVDAWIARCYAETSCAEWGAETW